MFLCIRYLHRLGFDPNHPQSFRNLRGKSFHRNNHLHRYVNQKLFHHVHCNGKRIYIKFVNLTSLHSLDIYHLRIIGFGIMNQPLHGGQDICTSRQKLFFLLIICQNNHILLIISSSINSSNNLMLPL